jgi:ATPase subunit of ABC transporter with duplicated ATPase domains
MGRRARGGPLVSELLLEAIDLVAGYEAPVVGPFSLRIEAGDVIGLAGPNGSGKSTLLKAIGDGVRIFSGRVTRRPALGLALQEQQPVRPNELPLSGRDYLRFAGADRRPPPTRLAAWLNHRVDLLSGGQFQLLSAWAALGGDAQLVLFDEPTNSLDPLGVQVLADALRTLAPGRAVLIVSHERPFLELTCRQILEIGA